MSYLTAQGRRVEYPLALHAEAVRTGNEDVLKIITATFEIFKCLQNADYELLTLRQEVQKLKYENEFMLKLVNDWSNKESSEKA